jgi:hypothetical protein
MKLALILSLVANAVLAALLIFSSVGDKPGAKPVAYCEALKKDIDFFIEGLARGNDPLYSPIVVQSLGSLLPSCFPDNETMINATMAELRKNLMHLVTNSTLEQRRQAHDNALRIFRELRQLYGSST